jgi:hypothetical protein
MADQPASMWPYWRDDKGVTAALQDYYPRLLDENIGLKTALAMRQNADLAIDSIMAGLAEQEDSEAMDEATEVEDIHQQEASLAILDDLDREAMLQQENSA